MNRKYGKFMRVTGLTSTGVIEVLMLLHEKKELNWTQIFKNSSVSQQPLDRAIEFLRASGLINDRPGPPPTKRLFFLTDIGRRIAEELSKIEAILNEATGANVL
jgi:predicted transcriptional regulator